MKISLSAFVAACFSLSINSIKADHYLEYAVILDPQLTNKFDITINMNKENYSEDNPAPTLCTSAATMIAGE